MNFVMERIAGIEPAPLAWKARALPLCNIRFFSIFLTRYGKHKKLSRHLPASKFSLPQNEIRGQERAI